MPESAETLTSLDDLLRAADRRLNLLPLVAMQFTFGGRPFAIEAVRDQDRLLEAAQDLGTFPFGLLLWESGVVMSEKIVLLLSSCSGPVSVLELGAGPGLPGIVAGSIGAGITQTDNSPEALALCRRNARANGVTGDVRYGDWRNWTDPATYDVVIGADILYERDHYADILRVAETALKPGGRLILTDPGRTHAGQFVEMLRAAGFAVTVERRMTDALPPSEPGARVAVDVIEAVRPSGSDRRG
jgi:predicted nicotinamide N-methyase